jgi:hypothetical protein
MAVGVSYFAESSEGKIHNYLLEPRERLVTMCRHQLREVMIRHDELVQLGGLGALLFGSGKMRFPMRRVGSIRANIHRA